MPTPQARRILRIDLVSLNLERTRRFYADVLGFNPSAEPGPCAPRSLRLGQQEIGLVGGARAPYPEPRAANDPWFQHFAIAVSDIDVAWRRLSGSGAEPISSGGPQLLPPSTGSVTAYKFRDPDGRPLELSHSPHSAWDRPTMDGPFLGIDHTAIAVQDLEVSLAFYTEVLGFAPGPRLLNTGPEQDRLDGLHDVRLNIAVLETALPGPHIELLHYETPVSAERSRRLNHEDVAATRTVVEVSSMSRLTQGLDRAGHAYRATGRELALVDPDGHFLTLVQAGR